MSHWVCCWNAEALHILGTLKSHIDYGTFYPILKAGEKALTADPSILADQVKEYEARRDALLSGLEKGGWSVPKSSATMFVWAKSLLVGNRVILPLN